MNEDRDYGAEQTELAEGEYHMGIMTTDELVRAVEEWGREKRIDNPIMQFAKLNEEVGEIAHELTRGRIHSAEIVDAIGDTAVTLIILADILGTDLHYCLGQAWWQIKDRKGHTKNGSFVKDER